MSQQPNKNKPDDGGRGCRCGCAGM